MYGYFDHPIYKYCRVIASLWGQNCEVDSSNSLTNKIIESPLICRLMIVDWGLPTGFVEALVVPS